MKKELLYNIAIGIVVMAIIVVALVRFVLPGSSGQGFAIEEIKNLTVSDLDGHSAPLSNFFSQEGDTYVLIFEMTDCYTCIIKGVEDLKTLKAAGKSCIGLAVHDLVDEVDGWSSNYDFSPFLVLKKADFYEHVATKITPVVAKIMDNKVVSFRYIRP